MFFLHIIKGNINKLYPWFISTVPVFTKISRRRLRRQRRRYTVFTTVFT